MATGLETASAAAGIVSLGITVCDGLISYYNARKDYSSDISSAREAIVDLAKTLTTLKSALTDPHLDQETKSRVEKSLEACEDALCRLSEKLTKFRKHSAPDGWRQKTSAELQRSWYPFRAKTISKLRGSVDDARNRLHLAVELLQLAQNRHLGTQVARILEIQQSERFQDLMRWLSVADPWTNHASARRDHTDQTGLWLLDSSAYQRWRTGTASHIWLYGKAGCGKSVLCSTAVEDIKALCGRSANSVYAVFYFSFSDIRKQSYSDMLRSLIAQLGLEESGLSVLLAAYQSGTRSVPQIETLEKILLDCISQHGRVYLLLDALDECPKGDVRWEMLQRTKCLLERAPNLCMLATSRHLPEVGETMQSVEATMVDVDSQAVDHDIQKYVRDEISKDQRLGRFSPTSRILIEETISKKAHGMFRWAACQLQELKNLDSTKAKYVEHVLRNLPATLEDTYSRMLNAINPMLRPEALTLLRWITYAKRPLTLAELAEAAIIDPDSEIEVDVENRGPPQEILTVLAGLVEVQTPLTHDVEDSESGINYDTASSSEGQDSEEGSSGTDDIGSEDGRTGVERDSTDESDIGAINTKTRVLLAHFSVKEYLGSEAALREETKFFHMESSDGHRVLAQSCLAYLLHCSSSTQELLSKEHHEIWPLLKYAADTWFFHSSLQQPHDIDRELAFLQSGKPRRDWIRLCNRDYLWELEDEPDATIGSVYLASALGLTPLVERLLQGDNIAEAFNGPNHDALQIATIEGHDRVVQLLLESGMDPNARISISCGVLVLASKYNRITIAQLLLDAGADVDKLDEFVGSALQVACSCGHEEMVHILIRAGANVNKQDNRGNRPIHEAANEGNLHIMQALLDGGAGFDLCEPDLEVVFRCAAREGNLGLLKAILTTEPTKSRSVEYLGSALLSASEAGQVDAVKILLISGADANSCDMCGWSCLRSAAGKGHGRVVQLLLDAGAEIDVSGRDSRYDRRTAL